MSTSRLLILILLSATLLIALVLSLIFIKFQFGLDIPYLRIMEPDDLQKWGQLGDFFGGVLNPLLSFAALIAVLYNIKIQSDELALTRDEARTTNIIQRQQAKTFERQLFDTTFFGLLNAHKSILEDVRIEGLGKVYTGREAFEHFNQILLDKFRYQVQTKYSFGSITDIQQIIKNEHDRFQSAFGHYFRNLYHILKLIDSADAIQDDTESEGRAQRVRDARDPDAAAKRKFLKAYSRRRQYSNFLRAQLSSHEVALLFINCLGEDGGGLKPYIELYSMLKTLRKQDIPGRRDVTIPFFDPLAYSDYEAIDQDHLWLFYKTLRLSRLRAILGKTQKQA